jgi:type I restriction enzyme S subunit
VRIRTVEFGEVCERIDYGFTAGADFSIKEPLLLRITDIQEGSVEWAHVPGCRISDKEEKENRLEVGDIVFARTGATTGKSFLIRNVPPRAVFASYLIRLRAGGEILPEYLAAFCQSEAYWRQIAGAVRGAAQGGVNSTTLSSLRLPLPSLSDQQRIAGPLEQADRLRHTRRYALELTDTLLPAAFLQLFGGTCDNFPLSSVEELAANKPHAVRTGPFGSQLLHSEFTDSGIAVLGIDNAVTNRFVWDERRFITPEKYGQLKRYTVFPGDVIITIMGTCGRCAIVPDDIATAINTKHLCCITLDQKRCLPVYLLGAFLHHPFVRHQLRAATKGAIMEGLSMEIIKGLRIPAPPLPLQQHFAALVERVERVRSVQRESLRQADHLFASQLNAAFS